MSLTEKHNQEQRGCRGCGQVDFHFSQCCNFPNGRGLGPIRVRDSERLLESDVLCRDCGHHFVSNIGICMFATGHGVCGHHCESRTSVLDSERSPAPEGEAVAETCKWTATFESVADTECDHVFNNWPGSASRMAEESYAGDDAFKFCPFCGRPICVI